MATRKTLQDIANAAGVARSTVSRALRNHPSIPSDTCVHIRQIAKEIGVSFEEFLGCL